MRNCSKALRGSNGLFTKQGDTQQKAVGDLQSCAELVNRPSGSEYRDSQKV